MKQKKEITMDFDLYIEEKRRAYERGASERQVEIVSAFTMLKQDPEKFKGAIFAVTNGNCRSIFDALDLDGYDERKSYLDQYGSE